MQEVTGSTDTMEKAIMAKDNSTLVYNKETNTMVKFTPSPKTTRRTYGTKAQRKALHKELVTRIDLRKQERINKGTAITLGLAASHIYANTSA